MRIRLCEATTRDIRRKYGTSSARARKARNYSVKIKEFTLDPLYIVFEVNGGTRPYEVDMAFKDVAPKSRAAIKNAIKNGQVKIGCSCLHPDTRIMLLDGSTPTVAELKNRFDNGEKLYCYSTDANGDFEPGEISNVFITKNTNEFIKITLDNDKEILTTPDHLYMLRDGSYEQAGNLHIGQSLMPMYFREDNGYISVYGKIHKGWHSVYKKVASVYHQADIENKIQESSNDTRNMSYQVAIHHRDFNKKNNNPENLQVMTAQEHWDYHSNLTFNNKPEYVQQSIREKSRKNMIYKNQHPTEKMIQSRIKWQEKGRLRNYDEDRKQQQSKIASRVFKEYYANLSDEQRQQRAEMLSKQSKASWANGCFDTEKFHKARIEAGKQWHTPEMEAKTTAGIRKYWSNLTEEEKQYRADITVNNARMNADKISNKKHQYWINISDEDKEKVKYNMAKARVLKNCEKVINYINSQGLEVNIDNILLNSKQVLGFKINDYTLNKYFNSIDDICDTAKINNNYNHKIKSIEHIILENPIPVYDISVPRYQNFVIDAGVVLHNCPDYKFRFAYHANKGGYGFDTEHRPANITNPRNDKGPGCKHVAAVLNNEDQWINELIRKARDDDFKE